MKRTIRAALLITAALLLNACHGHSNRIAQPPASAGWFLLTEPGSEPQDYQAYTYVIFTTRDFKDHPELKAPTQQRNGALLRAITGSRPNSSEKPINVFCIPVNSHATPAKVEPGNYDAKLADTYRSMLKVQLFTGGGGHDAKLSALKLGNNSGPFLVTSLTPISETKSKGTLLFTEMSNTDPGRIRDVVGLYRQPPANIQGDQPASNGEDFINQVANRLLNAHLAIAFVIRQ
jgi:hypothetical protein